MKTIRNNEKLMAEIGVSLKWPAIFGQKDGRSVTVVTFP